MTVIGWAMGAVPFAHICGVIGTVPIVYFIMPLTLGDISPILILETAARI
jgi:hypothetical protein